MEEKIKPFKLMLEGLLKECEKINLQLDELDRETQDFPFALMKLELEAPITFNRNTPQEDIYRELGRIEARKIFPYASLDQEYLESALNRYKQLLPLVEDSKVRGWVKVAITGLEVNIRMITPPTRK